MKKLNMIKTCVLNNLYLEDFNFNHVQNIEFGLVEDFGLDHSLNCENYIAVMLDDSVWIVYKNLADETGENIHVDYIPHIDAGYAETECFENIQNAIAFLSLQLISKLK